MTEVALMIQGKDVPASEGGSFERLNPMTGEVATRAAAATIAADAARGRSPPPPLSRLVGAWARRAPRAADRAAADQLERRAAEFVAAMADEIGATAGWARFNVMLAAGMLREAAAMTTQIGGEVIPSDRPG